MKVIITTAKDIIESNFDPSYLILHKVSALNLNN